MEGDATVDRALSRRLAQAEGAAVRQTELTIQRCRVWCVVAAAAQTAAFPGDRLWVGWVAVGLLAATTAWVEWCLRADAGGAPLPRLSALGSARIFQVGRHRQVTGAVAAIGALAMVGDVAATLVCLANLQSNPNDPIGLMPLMLVVEAATRWGPYGGIPGGIGGGLISAGWTLGVHRRHDIDLPLAFVTMRIVVLVLIGGLVGNTVRTARQQRRAAEAVFNASRDLVATFDLDGTLRSVNPASEAILGYTPDELIGRDRSFLLDLDDRPFGPPDLDLYRRAGAHLAEVRVVHRDGHLVWVELDLLPDLEGGVVHAIGRDVSDRRRAESELRHRVDHDSLTQVWNRDAMLAYLTRMIGRGYRPGLVFIDLDRFKEVNDSHGHVAGDRVLVGVAERLCVATGPEGSVARYAGDEFCIVVDDPADLEGVAARVRRVLGEPFDIGGVELAVSASLGLAVGGPGDDPELLVHRADLDMYDGKRTGDPV